MKNNPIDVFDDDDDLLDLFEDEEDEQLITNNGATRRNMQSCSVLAITKKNLRDAKLTYAERLVLSYIGAHKKGCFRSIAALSKNLGLSRVAIYDCLYELARMGYIVKDKKTWYAQMPSNKSIIQTFQIPNDILRMPFRQLTVKDKFVYLIIDRFLSADAAPSQMGIAKILGCHTCKQVLDSLKALSNSKNAEIKKVVERYEIMRTDFNKW